MRFHTGTIATFTLLLAAGLATGAGGLSAQEASETRDDTSSALHTPFSSTSSIYRRQDEIGAVFSDNGEDAFEGVQTDAGGSGAPSGNSRNGSPLAEDTAFGANDRSIRRTPPRTSASSGAATLSALPKPRAPARLPQLRTSPPATAITTSGIDRPGDMPTAPDIAPSEANGTSRGASDLAPAPGFPMAPSRGTEPGEGLRMGAFTLYGEVTESAVYTSRRGAANRPSAGLRLAPDLRLMSNWSRHELALSLSGSATAWTKNGKTKGGVEKEGTLGAALRLDARRHLRLRLGASHAITEIRIGSNRFQHDTDAAAAVEYARNRLRLTVMGGARRHHEPKTKTDDYTAPYAGLHARLRTTPALAIYGTLAADVRRHDQKRDSSGRKRDSKGVQAELGVEWLRGPILEGRMGVRAEARDYEQPGVKTLVGVGAAGLLTWRPRRSTTVEMEAAFGLTDDGGANPAREQTLALSIQQILRRGLEWRGRMEARRTDVRNGNDRLALRLETSLAWRIHRRLWIIGGYELEKEFEENAPDQRPIHTMHLGLRQRF